MNGCVHIQTKYIVEKMCPKIIYLKRSVCMRSLLCCATMAVYHKNISIFSIIFSPRIIINLRHFIEKLFFRHGNNENPVPCNFTALLRIGKKAKKDDNKNCDFTVNKVYKWWYKYGIHL